MPTLDDARTVLRDTYGFREFLPGQRDLIGRLLEGRSALAILPTGGGKSLCYQLPALLLDGLTLVVSPLTALMRDQVDFLTEHNVVAAQLDSSLDGTEVRQVYTQLRNGELDILFMTPEGLA